MIMPQLQFRMMVIGRCVGMYCMCVSVRAILDTLDLNLTQPNAGRRADLQIP